MPKEENNENVMALQMEAVMRMLDAFKYMFRAPGIPALPIL